MAGRILAWVFGGIGAITMFAMWVASLVSGLGSFVFGVLVLYWTGGMIFGWW